MYNVLVPVTCSKYRDMYMATCNMVTAPVPVQIVVFAALVLLALRALLCVALRCLSCVLCVPVGMS